MLINTYRSGSVRSTFLLLLHTLLHLYLPLLILPTITLSKPNQDNLNQVWQEADFQGVFGADNVLQRFEDLLTDMEENFGSDFKKELRLFELLEKELVSERGKVEQQGGGGAESVEPPQGVEPSGDVERSTSTHVSDLGTRTVVTNRTVVTIREPGNVTSSGDGKTRSREPVSVNPSSGVPTGRVRIWEHKNVEVKEKGTPPEHDHNLTTGTSDSKDRLEDVT